MGTDDADPGNPSGPDDPGMASSHKVYSPGQPATHELELDAYGVPVQDWPEGRAYLLIVGCFFFGGVSAWLGIMKHLAKLSQAQLHYLVAGCVLSAKNEWLGLIDVAGMELEALYGGFAGEPFNDDSREYVFVARRG